MMGMTHILKNDVNYRVTEYTDCENQYQGNAFEEQKAFSTCSRLYSYAEDDRKVMLVRGSFGPPMLPYMSGYFSEICSPAYDYYREELFLKEKPDIVIWEVVEKIVNGLNDYKMLYEK